MDHYQPVTVRKTYTLHGGTQVTVDITLDYEHRAIEDMVRRAYASKHRRNVQVNGALVVEFVEARQNGVQVS